MLFVNILKVYFDLFFWFMSQTWKRCWSIKSEVRFWPVLCNNKGSPLPNIHTDTQRLLTPIIRKLPQEIDFYWGFIRYWGNKTVRSVKGTWNYQKLLPHFHLYNEGNIQITFLPSSRTLLSPVPSARAARLFRERAEKEKRVLGQKVLEAKVQKWKSQSTKFYNSCFR